MATSLHLQLGQHFGDVELSVEEDLLRRKLLVLHRVEGGTFVGKEGAKKVKAKLDELAMELNAPRFGKAGAMLKEIGIEVEWDAVQARILGDTEEEERLTKLRLSRKGEEKN